MLYIQIDDRLDTEDFKVRPLDYFIGSLAKGASCILF